MLFLRDRGFLRIYFLQILYALSISFGWWFTLLYIVKLGFSYQQIMVYQVVCSLSIIATVLYVGSRRVGAYACMKLSTIAFGVGYLMIYLMETPLHLYLVGAVVGLVSPLFWLPFNTLYFGMRRRDNIASMSGVSFMVFPILGGILPLVSGAFIGAFGLRNLFLASAALTLLPLAYARKTQTKKTIEFNLAKAVASVKRLKTIILLEGLWQGADWLAVPLFTMQFITEGPKYGTFLAYVGIAGALAALLLCSVSDRERDKRVKYVFPAVALTGLFSVLSGFAVSLGYWLVIRGIVGFLVAVVSPFTTSVLIDKSRSIKDTMLARELLLNIGRLAGILVVAVVYLKTGLIQLSLVVSGALFMLYPIVVARKKLYPSRIKVRSLILNDILEYIRS